MSHVILLSYFFNVHDIHSLNYDQFYNLNKSILSIFLKDKFQYWRTIEKKPHGSLITQISTPVRKFEFSEISIRYRSKKSQYCMPLNRKLSYFVYLKIVDQNGRPFDVMFKKAKKIISKIICRRYLLLLLSFSLYLSSPSLSLEIIFNLKCRKMHSCWKKVT